MINMFLSVIIPAYNEEARIESTLSAIHEYFKSKEYDYEVIVVDDGSTDKTYLKLQQNELFEKDRFKIIKNDGNKGKGYSIKRGILSSKGEYVLVSDADMSTPIREINKLFGYTKEGFDIVIGSRSVKDSSVLIPQPWYREKMGKTFNLFVKLLLLKDFNDTQCGFKLFKGDVAREIARDLKINGFCYDVEALYSAKKKKYRIKEVGVTWNNSPQSKVNIFGSSVEMFVDLLRIKRLYE